MKRTKNRPLIAAIAIVVVLAVAAAIAWVAMACLKKSD